MKTVNVRVLIGLIALALLANAPSLHGGVSFEGGISWVGQSTIHDGSDPSTTVSFDPGVRLDFKVGGAFTNGFGWDIDLGLIYNQMKANPWNGENGTLGFYQFPMMIETTHTLPRFGPFRAYVGGGIGAVYGIFTGSDLGLFGFDSDLTFGYQATAGLKYVINDRWDIGVAYRFLGTTEHQINSGFGSAVKMDGTLTHSFMATISLRF